MNLKKLWGKLTRNAKAGPDKTEPNRTVPRVRAAGIAIRDVCGLPWRMPRKNAEARRMCLNGRFWRSLRARTPALKLSRAFRGVAVPKTLPERRLAKKRAARRVTALHTVAA